MTTRGTSDMCTHGQRLGACGVCHDWNRSTRLTMVEEADRDHPALMRAAREASRMERRIEDLEAQIQAVLAVHQRAMNGAPCQQCVVPDGYETCLTVRMLSSVTGGSAPNPTKATATNSPYRIPGPEHSELLAVAANPHYERCADCRGYGVVESFGPSVEDCRPCQGSGTVRARDARGRYV